MNEIVQMVAQKFNLSPETAQQIVDFIVSPGKGKAAGGNVTATRRPYGRRRRGTAACSTR